MDNSIHSDLIRGHINTIILKSLFEGDKYGYEICKVIADRSVGQYTLKQPTLYSSLKRLEAQGCIKSYWGTAQTNGGRRRYYTLTEMGRDIYLKSQAEWEYSRTIIDQLISDKVASVPLQSNVINYPVSKNQTDDEDEEEEEFEEEEEEKPIAAPTNNQEQPKPQPEEDVSQPSQEQPQAKRSVLDTLNHPDKKSYAESVLSGETDSAHTNISATKQPVIYPSFDDSAQMTEKEFKGKLSKLLLLTKTHILSDGIYASAVEKPHVIDTAESKSKHDDSVVKFENKLEKTVSEDEPTFNEIRYKLQADGFKIRTRTDKEHIKKEDVSDYINAGKIILHTMLITFLFILIEMSVIYFAFNEAFKLSLTTFIIICSCTIVLPMFGVLYNAHMKNKRVYDKYKFSYSFVITLLLTIIAASIALAVAMLSGVILSETHLLMQRIILPSIIAFNMVLGSLVYFVLYKSKRYFV